MSVSPRVVGGLALGGAILLAWQDERARGTSNVYREDGTLREDWALVPIAQRAALAQKNGWSSTTDQTKPRPVTETADAQRVTDYWIARLKRADLAAAGGDGGAYTNATEQAIAREGGGPRVTAFRGRIRAAKLAQGDAAPDDWRTLSGPLGPAALNLFWGAIDSAATTVHGVLSQIDQGEVRAMFGEIGVNFAGTLGDMIGAVAGTAADVAATSAGIAVAAVLSHPLVLGAAGLAIALYFRGGTTAGGST